MAISGQNDSPVQVQIYPLDSLLWGIPIANDAQFGSAAVVYELNVNPTSYTTTFASVQLLVDRQLDVNPTSYTLTLADIDLVYTPAATVYELNVNPASFTTTFASVQLLVDRVLDVNPVALSTTFADIDLVYTSTGTVYELNVNPLDLTTDFVSVDLQYSGTPIIPQSGSGGGGGWDPHEWKRKRKLHDIFDAIKLPEPTGELSAAIAEEAPPAADPAKVQEFSEFLLKLRTPVRVQQPRQAQVRLVRKKKPALVEDEDYDDEELAMIALLV